MLNCRTDENFDAELVPGSESSRKKLLKKSLISKGLVVSYRGDIYIFLFGTNCWGNLTSAEAQSQICEIVGYSNVSVSYLGAMEPFINYLERSAAKVGAIPTSICVGTKRMQIMLTEDGLVTTEVHGLLAVPGDSGIDPSVTGFSVSPCTDKLIPDSWEYGSTTRIEAQLSPIFDNNLELSTMKWLIGGTLLDPIVQAKFVLLYGQGGTGKSTVLNLLYNLMKGAVGVIPDDVITGTRNSVGTQSLLQVTSKRLCTSGEIDVKSSKLNIHNMKVLTGGDKVPIPPTMATTRSTIMVASNYLPSVDKEPEWYTTQVVRRVVIQPFSINAMEIPECNISDEGVDMLDFKMACIHTRLSNRHMPMSTRAVLLTLLGSSYYTTSGWLEETSEAEMQEVIDANMITEARLELPQGSLGMHANYVTPSCVVTYHGIKYLNNIRLKSG